MSTASAALTALQGTTPLTDWGVIRAGGEDARSFLHGQLTQDMQGLPPGRARLAGYCSAKGRLLASFVVWADVNGDLLLACSADLLPAVLKRLSMFVLRAKCKLSDATAELPLHGLAGPAVPAGDAWQVVGLGEQRVVLLPTVDGVRRAIVVGAAPDAPALDAEAWRWLEARSGIARVRAVNSEQFVPQMVNWEVVGGVNFQKGCYPGQEVVARSQYRGTTKRRAYVVQANAPLAAGQDVFAVSDAEQPAGRVVLAAAPAGLPPAALVELKIAAATEALHAGAAGGPVLRLATLPYALPTGDD
ncbi:MAG: folate-binding protein YgfZ [Burkholderiaceae bacterium]|nr:folate-binding protein YgfZ [Rhodoferax sp.]MCP5285484.1 folate-binding protein YgfZ [Burkholderiaceae bacterium]